MNPFMHKLLLIATVLLAGVHSARAEIVDIRWAGDGRFTYQDQIATGQFVEVCGKLPAGLKVRWDFSASAPLEFNLHYHAGKKVVYPFKLSGAAAAKNTLRTKIEQDYCWMWTNKSPAPATLSVTLRR